MKHEYTTVAFEAFWKKAELEEIGKRPNPRYLNINPEGTLLREAQDIDEELRMMIRIYSQQLGAVEDFRKSLERWNRQRSLEDHSTAPSTKGVSNLPVSSMDLDFVGEMVEQIQKRKAEIEELASAADRTCHEVSTTQIPRTRLCFTHALTLQQLQGLLALKQQQASIVEAKAALERADHGVRQADLNLELAGHGQQQALSSHKLSEQSFEQGRSIMAFTIMTIIFVSSNRSQSFRNLTLT